MSRPKLIFVYNANSGLWNAALDSMHKIISPDTYNCKLCQITYGTFSEMPDWKKFRDNFPGEMVFLHTDEFEKHSPPQPGYPVVLSENEDGELDVVLSTQGINDMRDLEELTSFFKDWSAIHLS